MPEIIDRAMTEAACPQCGSPAGVRCVNPVSGAPWKHAVLSHRARVEAWRRAGAQGPRTDVRDA